MVQPEGSVPGNWAVVSTLGGSSLTLQRASHDCRPYLRGGKTSHERLPTEALDHTSLCGSDLPGLHWHLFISVMFGIIYLPDSWPARAPQPLPLLRALPTTCSHQSFQ